MNIDKYFYKERVALNVLANSIENAKAVCEAAEGHVLIGVLSKNYHTVAEAVSAMKEFDASIDGAVSIGLGDGDSRQAAIVSEIVKVYEGSHINQVFTSVGATRANLGERDSWINALVSPSGIPGYVTISTGPISSDTKEQAIVSLQAAIALVKDMGGNALKFFPMKGLTHEEEFRAVAKGCAEADFALEPTGGIDLHNFEKILDITLQAGVPKVIPHVYSSIVDEETGQTNVEDIKKLLAIVKRTVNKHG